MPTNQISALKPSCPGGDQICYQNGCSHSKSQGFRVWSLYVHSGPPSIAKLVCNIVTSISQVLFIFQLHAIDLLIKPHGTQGKHRKHGDVFIGGLHRWTVHHRKPLAALRQQCQALGDASGRASIGAWKLVWTCLNLQGNSKINDRVYPKKHLANYSVIVNNWKGRHGKQWWYQCWKHGSGLVPGNNLRMQGKLTHIHGYQKLAQHSYLIAVPGFQGSRSHAGFQSQQQTAHHY